MFIAYIDTIPALRQDAARMAQQEGGDAEPGGAGVAHRVGESGQWTESRALSRVPTSTCD